jgi:hypothetical protein
MTLPPMASRAARGLVADEARTAGPLRAAGVVPGAVHLQGRRRGTVIGPQTRPAARGACRTTESGARRKTEGTGRGAPTARLILSMRDVEVSDQLQVPAEMVVT